MTTQLVLLDNIAPAWRLDDEARAAGLRGVALARSALRDSPRSSPQAGRDPGGRDRPGDRIDRADAA